MYLKYKIDLGYKNFNIMPRKRDNELEIITDIAVHVNFTEVTDGKTFFKEVCAYYAERCGKSKHKAHNRDELWWRDRKGLKIPYNSTPAAKRRRAEEESESVTPIAQPRNTRSRYT